MAKTDQRPFSRKGLHRLECPACPCYGYFTVAMLENAGGVPECFRPGCGETMVPVELELMAILGVDHPALEDHARRTRHKELSQRRSLGDFELQRRRNDGTLNDMGAAAFDELRAELAEASHARRLRGPRTARDEVRQGHNPNQDPGRRCPDGFLGRPRCSTE